MLAIELPAHVTIELGDEAKVAYRNGVTVSFRRLPNFYDNVPRYQARTQCPDGTTSDRVLTREGLRHYLETLREEER